MLLPQGMQGSPAAVAGGGRSLASDLPAFLAARAAVTPGAAGRHSGGGGPGGGRREAGPGLARAGGRQVARQDMNPRQVGACLRAARE
jgi:hypothetical protein